MSSGGGYSGGMGGFGGGFGQPPMFGGGFGGGFGQPPQYGGGFGGGFGQPPQFGGGFGGGFGQPQQPQFGNGDVGGFGQPQPMPSFDYGSRLGAQMQFGGGFGGGFGQPPQFGGGFGGPGNAYARPFPTQQPSVGMFPPTSPNPNQPPPGMELNPDYIDRFAGGRIGSLELRPTDNKFRPIQARTGTDQTPTGGGYPSRDQFNQTFQAMPAVMPQPQTGGAVYAGGTPGFYDQGGGGYSSPYMSSPMMGGLASLFGGIQGGGFGGMFNPQAQAQAQMRAYQQNQQRNPNQPPPGMELNPDYDRAYAMTDTVDLPGSQGYMKRQQFIPMAQLQSF